MQSGKDEYLIGLFHMIPCTWIWENVSFSLYSQRVDLNTNSKPVSTTCSTGTVLEYKAVI